MSLRGRLWRWTVNRLRLSLIAMAFVLAAPFLFALDVVYTGIRGCWYAALGHGADGVRIAFTELGSRWKRWARTYGFRGVRRLAGFD